jgi:NAD(P)-dependent dehydrogenase (short-subunit alcohol dehydrogenase family)
MELSGKTAVITGAAGGLGQAIAKALAAEGAAVGLVDVTDRVETVAAELATTGANAAAAVFDITEADAIRAGLAALEATLGDIDILVNNAGIVDNAAPLARMEVAAWRRELDVNLTGQFNMIQALVEGMAARGWGRIVNISSVAARGGLHNQAGYAASKAGVLGLTRAVTLEYARRGVTCNAVLPGLVLTEKVRTMPQEILDNTAHTTPARRLGEVAEIANVVVFLASPRASYLCGAEIDVDGGHRLNTSALASRREVAETRGVSEGKPAS